MQSLRDKILVFYREKKKGFVEKMGYTRLSYTRLFLCFIKFSMLPI